MKTLKFILAFLLISCTLQAQNASFSYDIEGLKPNYVVTNMDGMSQASLYKKALAWAKTGNRKVLSTEENKKVVFQGEKENAMCFIVMGKKSCNALRYQVAVAFKDNKYKLEVEGLEQYGPINDTGKKGWFPFELDKAPDAFYTRGGDLKKEYVETPDNIANLFNSLNKEIKKGLLEASSEDEDDGW